MIINTEG